jgi:hypothetical protein
MFEICAFLPVVRSGAVSARTRTHNQHRAPTPASPRDHVFSAES